MNHWHVRKMTHPLDLYFFSFVLISMLTSCVENNIAKPPQSMVENPQVLVHGCIDISGVYRNKGIDAPDNKDKEIHSKHPKYLSRFFTSGSLVNGRKHQWVTHIKLVGPKQGELKGFIKKRDKTIDTVALKQGEDFTCTPDGIEITSHYTKLYDIGGGVGWQTKLLVFNKANDGSLLIKESEKEKGVALILIPFKTSTTQYYRFPIMNNLP